MAYDPKTVRSQIISLLNAVRDGSNNAVFANVYDWPNPNPSGSPCIIMDISNDDGQFLDNITNLHAMTFNIWIVQEITVKGQDAAIAILDDATKYAVAALEKLSNASLSGNISWMMPTSGVRKQVQTPGGPVFYKELILTCNMTETIV